MITIDDFRKIELKAATVRSAEPVPGSEKLTKLEVDLGGEIRQIIAGIGKYYAAEALVGRTVIVAANLEPRLMMGLESQGMILAASDEQGIALLSADRAVIPGSIIR